MPDGIVYCSTLDSLWPCLAMASDDATRRSCRIVVSLCGLSIILQTKPLNHVAFCNTPLNSPAKMTALHTFLHRLFTLNEQFRHDDATLLTTVSARFPEHISAPNRYRSRIVVWRSKYNTGQLGQPPKCFAFKYLAGVPVNRNDNPLTEDQIKQHQYQFRVRFPRLKEEVSC